jgi:hypothetical protein
MHVGHDYSAFLKAWGTANRFRIIRVGVPLVIMPGKWRNLISFVTPITITKSHPFIMITLAHFLKIISPLAHTLLFHDGTLRKTMVSGQLHNSLRFLPSYLVSTLRQARNTATIRVELASMLDPIFHIYHLTVCSEAPIRHPNTTLTDGGWRIGFVGIYLKRRQIVEEQVHCCAGKVNRGEMSLKAAAAEATDAEGKAGRCGEGNF